MRDGDFLPCAKRLELVQFNADGSKDRVHRCAEPTAEKANQNVTPVDCAACPVRRASLAKSLADKTFTPVHKFDGRGARARYPDRGGDGFPSCADRLVVEMPVCCGQTIERRICNSLDCVYFQGEVTPVICAQCPVRRTAATPKG